MEKGGDIMMENELKKKFYNGMDDIIARGLFDKDFGRELICIIYNALELGEPILPKDITLINTSIINGVEFKTSELDVRFNIVNTNNYINADIEFQNIKKKDFFKRLGYYQASQTVHSVKKGSLYDYNVVVISICDFIVDKKLSYQDFITITQRRDINRLDGMKFNFDTIVIIQLPYINKCDKIKLVRLLEIMKSENPIELKGDDPLMNKVINGIYELNEDEKTRELIRLREKAEIDSMLALDYAKDEAKRVGHEEGLAEGRAEGRAEGLAEGRLEEKIRMAKELKKYNTSLELIISVTNLSKEEIEKL
jgi:predicted transposase/invertase (TIGR01784 family)